MKKHLFTGLCTAMVTPFIGNQVNYPLLELLIRRQIHAGVSAIVLAGTTGEAPTLSDEEKLEIFRCGVTAAKGQCAVIAGTGSNDTGHTIRLSQAAQEIGVDGLLVVTPYYNKTTDAGLVRHYRQITEAVDLPVIAYNVPSRTGYDIPIHVYPALAQLPGIAGVKEASGDLSKLLRIMAQNGNDLPVWSGNDDLTVPTMSIGAQGVISVLSNVAPAHMNAMVHAALSGDYALAGMLQRKLQPLCDLMFCQVNPIPVKAAMEAMEYHVGPCRMPLDGLTPENAQRIHGYFREFGEMLDCNDL